MIFDFIGLDAMTNNPLEKIGIYVWNRIWATVDKRGPVADLSLFIGEEANIPDRPFDLFLPNRRQWAKERCEFVGYVLPFDPANLADKAPIREALGYGANPLIVCSVGGSSAGKPLLELFGRAFPRIEGNLPGVQMILVCGPRIAPESLDIPEGPEVKGYVPDLYKHYAACDLALIMGGGSSTVELTALKRPFIYFPLEEHCEQTLNVAARVERHRAGVRMTYSQTSPNLLAEKILDTIGKEVDYAELPTYGGKKAAELINNLI
jgi:UDP-N-acetylglucosamine:LPS N-acetylglucosamine transferase